MHSEINAMPPYKKRRVSHGPSKNELRAARHSRADEERARSGTLRQWFPQVSRLQLDFRLESAVGIPLENISRNIGLDEPLELDILCPSTCNGSFRLIPLLENTIQAAKEIHDGMGVCQVPSYMDPRIPCGSKLFYRLTIEYR